MTIATTTARVSYVGNGSTATFAIPFYFQSNADIVVMLQNITGTQTTLVLGTDYTLTGVGVSSGGSVTFISIPTATTGAVITIYRDPPVTQTTSYNNSDPFPAKSHENALDKLTMLEQRTRDLNARALRLSDSDPTTSLTIPTLPQRLGKLLGFDPGTGAAVASVNTMAAMDAVISGALATSGGLNRIVLTANMASLRALTPFAGAVVYMQGYYADNDGGEGIYCWESVSVLTDNGGTIIQPNAGGTGRWIRNINSSVNVRSFGAKGDGTTNDTAAIQACIDWIGANGVVSLPSGTFKIVTGLTISHNGVHLRGAGVYATQLLFAPTVAGVAVTFSASPTQIKFCTLSGIQFYSNDSTFKKTAIKLVDVSNFDIFDWAIEGSVAGSLSSLFWTGASSIGIDIYGRDLTTIRRGSIYADFPIKINQDATVATESLDHFNFSELALIANGANDLVTVADGCILTQVTFSNVAFVGGRDGFRFLDTTSTLLSSGLVFDNCRFEQTVSAAGASYAINISTNSNLYGLSVRTCRMGADNRAGLTLHKVIDPRFDTLMYESTTQAALTVDATVANLGFDNCFWQSGSTAVMTGQSLMWGTAKYPSSTSPLPPSARYSNQAGNVVGYDFYTGGALAGTAYTAVANAGIVSLGTGLNGVLIISSSGGANAVMSAAGASHITSYLAATDFSGQYSATAGTASKTNVYWSAGNARYELQNNTGGTLSYRVICLGSAQAF